MPVKKLVRVPRSPNAVSLRQRLAAEWSNPASSAPQPVILEERRGAGQPLHVYVIWDEWAPLGMVERSEIIMDAYEDSHGTAPSLDVTVAMGLTESEADRMGIGYQ
jgi:hypothetical protein